VQGGPKVANALATAPGNPHTFQPTKTHHQDHVRPRDRLCHSENIGEVLIGHPTMGSDDKVADIRQDCRESAKADRRDQSEVCGQRDRSGRTGHPALAFSIRATAMLTGTRPNRTTRSGSLAKVMRPKARTAISTAAGRRRCGKRSLMPCRDQKPGCRRGNPAEDVPEDRQVSIFKEEQADRETDYPRDDEKAGNCCDRSDRAPHLCSDAHGNSDDVRPGHELAKADDVAKFAVIEPATLLDGDAARPHNPPPPPTPQSETARNAVIGATSVSEKRA